MAVNISKRVGNVKNKRSHALNATKSRQKLNLQVKQQQLRKLKNILKTTHL